MTALLEVARITTKPGGAQKKENALLRYKAFLDDIKTTIPNNKWVPLSPVQMCTVHGVNTNLVSAMVKNKILERQQQGKSSMYKATNNLLSVTPKSLISMANSYSNSSTRKQEVKPKSPTPYTPAATQEKVIPTTKVLLSIARYDGTRSAEFFEQTKVDEEQLAELATKILHEQASAQEVTISMILLTAKRNIVIER